MTEYRISIYDGDNNEICCLTTPCLDKARDAFNRWAARGHKVRAFSVVSTEIDL